MHRVLVLVGVAVAVLAVGGKASAALEVGLSVEPARVHVGRAASIVVRPYWPYKREDGTCCRFEPADVEYPFRIEAVSPAGRVFRIPVAQTSDAYVWRGVFTFRAPGRWQVRAANWGPRYRSLGVVKPRITVVVRR